MRFLVRTMTSALSIFLVAALMPGVQVTSMSMAILISLLLILLNVFVKPLFIFLTLPITVFSLGLFLLVINAVIILIASHLLHTGFKVDGFWSAMLFSILVSLTTGVFNSIGDRLDSEKQQPYQDR